MKKTPSQPIYAKTVKKLLIERDSNVTELAAEIGKPRNSVSTAINNPTVLPGIRALVSSYLGIRQS